MLTDKQLIEYLVRGYSEIRRIPLKIESHPDELNRHEEAVDAIAVDDGGKATAIEHTLLEPFVGERADAQPFLTVFSNLEKDPSLILKNYDITLVVPAFSIPTGTDWKKVGEQITQWFLDNRTAFPEGESNQDVTGLGFPLQIRVEKTSLEDVPGYVFIARSIPSEGISPVVQRALVQKVPKLSRAPAERRILLLERKDASYGYARIRQEIEKASHAVPEFASVTETWLATTLSWDNSRTIWFHDIYPTFRESDFYLTETSDGIRVRLRARG